MCLRKTEPKALCRSDFHWVTIANKENKILDLLKITAIFQDIDFIILGGQYANMTEPWLRSENSHLGLKLLEINNYVKNENLPEDDILLITDAFDVVFVGEIDTVIKRYQNLNKAIIFGAENGCWPIGPQCERLPNAPLRGLNSGTIIGRIKDFRKLMSDYTFDEEKDDQEYWTEKYIANPDLIGLDNDRDLFLTLSFMIDDARNHMHWEPNGVFGWKDKTPQFIHRCGESKDWLDKAVVYMYQKYAFLEKSLAIQSIIETLD